MTKVIQDFCYNENMNKTQKILLAILGYVCIPILFYLPFRTMSCISYNYTGLLNHDGVSFITILPGKIALLLLYLMYYQLGKHRIETKKWNRFMLVLGILIISVVLVPYRDGEDFLSGLHVFLGYVTFFAFNYLLFLTSYHRTTLRHIYVAGLFFVWMVTLYYLSVNGLAEIIYGSLVSFTITTQILTK